MTTTTPTALITGASKGFGLALAEALAQRGWKLIINARNADKLLKAQRKLEEFTEVLAISGDVRDEIHLLQFAEKLAQLNWRLDLIINNASTLGTSPQPLLLEYENETIHQIFHTNVIAPLSLIRKVKSFLAPNATIINLSSDAAANNYENWGGYGASKAALDHISLTLGKEYPGMECLRLRPRRYAH
jgi:NAD(P)-dependent dehydrogenase (short-subunit alcohol dehydrogenase family)